MPESSNESWYIFRNACVLTRAPEATVDDSPACQNEILFLHGRFWDSLSWEPLTRHLQSQAQCWTLDMPGFGRSFCMDERETSFQDLVSLVAEVARAAIELKPDARWLLAGHDLGAFIAQLAAIEIRRPVDLILVNPLSFSTPLHEQGWAWLVSRLFQRKRASSLEMASEMRVIRRLIETWPGPREQLHWRRKMREFPGSVLVLSSASDPVVSSRVAHGIFATYPNAEYFEHPRAGHDLCREDPDWVVDKVKTFLFRTSPQCGKVA